MAVKKKTNFEKIVRVQKKNVGKNIKKIGTFLVSQNKMKSFLLFYKETSMHFFFFWGGGGFWPVLL